MKKSLIAIAVLALSALTGCASLEHAGHSGYTVKPYSIAGKDGAQALACCELAVNDGKEYSGRAISFQTDGAGFALQVQEGQSKAFKGQAIGAKALSVLPVTGLQDLVK